MNPTYGSSPVPTPTNYLPEFMGSRVPSGIGIGNGSDRMTDHDIGLTDYPPTWLLFSSFFLPVPTR